MSPFIFTWLMSECPIFCASKHDSGVGKAIKRNVVDAFQFTQVSDDGFLVGAAAAIGGLSIVCVLAQKGTTSGYIGSQKARDVQI